MWFSYFPVTRSWVNVFVRDLRVSYPARVNIMMNELLRSERDASHT